MPGAPGTDVGGAARPASASGGRIRHTVRLAGASCGDLPQIADAAEIAPADARTLSRTFFRRLDELSEGTHEYQYVRNTLIEMNQSLVRFAARRFSHRGREEVEDIFQSGVIGLIKAIDRFDLSREVEFTTFALPYIRGEMKRHLRDTTWAVHVPRRLQERRLEFAKARGALESRLGREPTVAELAAQMSVERAEVIEAMAASNGYTAASLDAPVRAPGEGDASRSGEWSDGSGRVPGAEDPALALFENCHALAPLLDDLDEQDVRLLRLRFGEERTQREIGDEFGCSQMNISRRLCAIYAKLRAGLLAE